MMARDLAQAAAFSWDRSAGLLLRTLEAIRS